LNQDEEFAKPIVVEPIKLHVIRSSIDVHSYKPYIRNVQSLP